MQCQDSTSLSSSLPPSLLLVFLPSSFPADIHSFTHSLTHKGKHSLLLTFCFTFAFTTSLSLFTTSTTFHSKFIDLQIKEEELCTFAQCLDVLLLQTDLGGNGKGMCSGGELCW
jgi:hypothetical protein